MTRLLALLLLALALLMAGSLAFAAVDDSRGSATPGQAGKPKDKKGPKGTKAKPVVLAFGGDVHFEGILAEKLAASPSTVLDPIEDVLAEADIAVVNLETAVTNGGFPAVKEYVFRAPPTAFAALRGGSVDVASLANNHGMDYGVDGLRDSLAAAKRYRVPVVGGGMSAAQAYAPYRATVKGQRIAIIGATQVLDDHLISAWTAGPAKPGLASAKDVTRLVHEVRQARRTADTVVVFLHWGIEAEPCPSHRQRRLAKQLVAAGADILVGGHAHRQQGAGKMGNALVGYGLGNFVWYGTSDLSTRTGVLLVTVTGRRIDEYRWVPARIVDGVPRPLTGAARRDEVAAWRGLRACTGLKP
jgi:poly-gamma-glutamate capsule biosynthesis protein CapA/YwtB (metallophosphatase superfamily)